MTAPTTDAPVVLGIDLGTQSLKVVACAADLTVLGAGRVGYPLRHPRPGWAEQDPARWLDALAPAVAAALSAAGRAPADVAALGVAGQLDGLVAVDANGAALGPCLPWLDRRATGELPALARDADRFGALTGQVADPGHLAAKARWWDRHHPTPRAAAFHQPVSFVVEALTGARVLDHAHASTTMVYDLAARTWSDELLAAFELDADRLPAIAAAEAVAGSLGAAGARLTGLPPGVPVAVGTGDDFATPLGAGVGPGLLACVIGTAEVVGTVAPAPVIDGGGAGRLVETHAHPGGGYLIENPGWLSGGAITWLGELLGLDAETFDAAAAAAPPGAGGVGFLPALGGAMTPEWNPDARGAFVGLTPAHGPSHLARAVLEGCAMAMRDVAERLIALGLPLRAARLLGGGARSPTAARIRADALGVPVEQVADPDTCPVGAAMLAAVAAGLQPSLAAAAAALPGPVATVAPDPGRAALYDAVHARHRALYAAIAGLAPMSIG